MDYKDTLLMPQTDFSMRGNLPENEKGMRTKWEQMDLYHKMQEKNKEGKPFILHDGPPYANGNIHIGHAFNKILKDFINRFKMMEGYCVTYIPGWDVHGLPIETAIAKTGVDRKTMSKSEFRHLCSEYATAQVELQKEGFMALNIIGDWEHPYITMTKEYEAAQLMVFAEMARKGLIFKGMKPVYWSPSSESALAEAEIEYHDRKDPSIFVAFPVVDGKGILNGDDQLVIWTTTPWTLPGNLGIAVGEEFSYSRVFVNEKHYIVATELLDTLAPDFGWESYQIEQTFRGKELEGVLYHHVFMDRTSPVVIADHVTLESGTGLVHTAPSYGVDDFNVGQKYHLGMVHGVDDQGILNENSGEFAGLYFEDANKVIVQKLEELGVLLKLKFITHSYPHDWRTKKPVIFRATSQWFCSIDSIRENILEQIKAVKWYPGWGELRLSNMIKDRGDWCISRQRVWGVPLPIFYNEDGSEILDYDVIKHVSSLFREHGSNIWFEKEAKELLPEGYTNPKSPNGKFTKETDIMDVWFDSGSSHTAVLKERQLPYPADIYLEGSDQYRGWFNSSLICGTAVYGQSPYKTCISAGFVLDGKGMKMSKSLGNTIEPLKMIHLHGSDILRLWVSSVDYSEDVRISDDIIAQVKESYRKIRNTYRFMLGNLFDFDPEKDQIPFEEMLPYDQYMMVKWNAYLKEVLESYHDYRFADIYKITNNFISFTLSNFYLDFTKDILYIEKFDSHVRRSVQTVLYHILFGMIRVLAPILPYTSEEVYGYLKGKEQSVHLERFPEITVYENETAILGLWNQFFAVKDDVFKALEEARNEKIIGKGLEASIRLHVDSSHQEVVTALKDYLKQLLIVSEVVFTEEELPHYNVSSVHVEPYIGERCERCWNYFDEKVLENHICPRCQKVVY